jgi:hypothetical protein
MAFLWVRIKEWKRPRTASIVTAFVPPLQDHRALLVGWRASLGEATPRPILMNKNQLDYWGRNPGWQGVSKLRRTQFRYSSKE